MRCLNEGWCPTQCPRAVAGDVLEAAGAPAEVAWNTTCERLRTINAEGRAGLCVGLW